MKNILRIQIFVCLLFTPRFVFGEALPDYHETVRVLQDLCRNETAACRRYSAFARKALEEDRVGVARLFISLHASESIHARNFKDLLEKLGATAQEVSECEISVSDTKTNLKYALYAELSEIDTTYPDYIARITPEGYEAALRDITYSWKAEKQHRALMKEMLSAIGFFFGRITDKLKEANSFYVCQRCGSTLVVLPEGNCPICGSPMSLYREINAPKN